MGDSCLRIFLCALQEALELLQRQAAMKLNTFNTYLRQQRIAECRRKLRPRYTGEQAQTILRAGYADMHGPLRICG